jgi:hypothetical protein
MYRTPGPHFCMAGAMHPWHRGKPPRSYLWVLRWLLCTTSIGGWSAEFGSPDHPASRGRADGVVLRCLLGMAFA